MTEKLYYTDAYLRETEAVVLSSENGRVVLDRTIFYPEGGGQPGDRGFLGPFMVTDTQKGDNGTVIHYIDGEAEVGKTYKLVLDWDHRYHYMREHSAQHLLSSLLFHEASIGTVAVHQGEDAFTIETNTGEISEETLLTIERRAQEEINKGRRIWHETKSHEEAESLHMRRSIKVQGDVMLVYIEGNDVVACGGVHLASTSEIGTVEYAGQEKLRGHVRTIWKCGPDAERARHQRRAIVNELSAKLSAMPDAIVPAVDRLLKENADEKRKVKALESELARFLLSLNGEKAFISSVPVAAYEGLEVSSRPLLIADREGRFVFFGPDEEFRRLKQSLPVKGGGRGGMSRGSYQGTPEEFLERALGLL